MHTVFSDERSLFVSLPDHYNLHNFGQVLRMFRESFLKTVEADNDDAGLLDSSKKVFKFLDFALDDLKAILNLR